MSGSVTSSVRVTGLSDLMKFFDELPGKLQSNVMRGALRAGAVPVRDEAKANAPMATGTLRDGIKISTSSRGGVVRAKVRLTGKHAYLGRWLEFTGAAPHMIKPRARKSLFLAGLAREVVDHPGFAAKPFMRPALDAQAAAAVVAAGEYIKRRLTKQGLDASGIDIEAES